MDNNFNFDPMTGAPIRKSTDNYSTPAYGGDISPKHCRKPVYSKAKSITGMSIAIAGLAFSWLGIYFAIGGIIPLVLCIVGLALTKRPPFTKPAKICGIIGIVLTVIFMIVGVVFIFLIADGGFYVEDIFEDLLYY